MSEKQELGAQELAKLHDIHLPDPISWWPLAPGWYVLLLVVIALSALLVYFIRRSYKNSRPKREALELLRRYEQEYQREANAQSTSMKLSELLRRVALVYFPRDEVAGLKGEAWLSFLTKTSKQIDFNKLADYLLVLPYQHHTKPTPPDPTPTFRGLSAESRDPAHKLQGVTIVDLTPLFSQTRRWIKQRGKPCLNQQHLGS